MKIGSHIVGLMLLCCAASSVAQISTGDYRWLSYGIGDSKVASVTHMPCFSMSYMGTKLVPFLNHHVGVNFSTSQERNGFYTFVHFNVGGGYVSPYLVASASLGPSITLNALDQTDDLMTPAHMSVPKQEPGGFAPGFNTTVSLIVRSFRRFGIGGEYFTNHSRVGSSQGVKLVIHISNGK